MSIQTISTSDGATPDPQQTGAIVLQGIETNNLKNIDIRIEHGEFVVLTGPSGCGKSSLAFDTLFAEGRRQFLDSLSIQARQSLQYLPRPAIKSVDGLQPVVCIQQQRSRPNARSTVATITEIHDHLRLLMARTGTVLCADCKIPIDQASSDEVEQRLLGLPERTKVIILAPFGKQDQTLVEKADEIRKAGFVRCRYQNEIVDIDSLEKLVTESSGTVPDNTIDVVVDRLIIKPGIEDRLSESITHGLKIGNQVLELLILKPNADPDQWERQTFSTLFRCTRCGLTYDEIEPRTFSFHSPSGVCLGCEGTGAVEGFLFDSIFAPPDCELIDLPILNLLADSGEKLRKEYQALLESHGIDPSATIGSIESERLIPVFRGRDRRHGLSTLLEKEFATCIDRQLLDRLLEFRGDSCCPECQGSRLGTAANNVFLGERNIAQICEMSIDDALQFFAHLGQTLAPHQQEIAEPITREIRGRLGFLSDIGLGYLGLDRRADSLSGGEFQRVRLATGLGNRLTDVCYILDEPTSGMHPHDFGRLIGTLKNLQQLGNTILVVEHEPELMKAADRIIDLGPGAGEEGGTVLATGSLDQVLESPTSVTGRFLKDRPSCLQTGEREKKQESWIRLSGATLHNLRGDEFKVPAVAFVCVCGVSGSGKSSFVNQTLVPAVEREMGLNRHPGPYESLSLPTSIRRIAAIDQLPIGRSSRSNAATFTGLFDELRKIFAQTRLAKQLGFNASRFSFNNRAGACRKCGGHGQIRIEMKFMPDVHAICNACNGKRFNESTLQVRYKGLNIAEMLELSVDRAFELLEGIEKIRMRLAALKKVGLGYLKLGQPANSLSGGEAQRLKIADRLAVPEMHNCLFVLDEPTTGLHPLDTQRLIDVFRSLVEQGHSLIVVEHDLDVIGAADFVVEFGPGGGAKGGRIIASGTPVELADHPQSLTGGFLKAPR